MQSGYERRKYQRLPIVLHLEVNQVYRQDHMSVDDINVEVIVYDISKTGIGFVSKGELPVGYYFNAKIGLGEREFFYAVIKIVRSERRDERYIIYGAEFVGLAPFLANKIDEYGKHIREKNGYTI